MAVRNEATLYGWLASSAVVGNEGRAGKVANKTLKIPQEHNRPHDNRPHDNRNEDMTKATQGNNRGTITPIATTNFGMLYNPH